MLVAFVTYLSDTGAVKHASLASLNAYIIQLEAIHAWTAFSAASCSDFLGKPIELGGCAYFRSPLRLLGHARRHKIELQKLAVSRLRQFGDPIRSGWTRQTARVLGWASLPQALGSWAIERSRALGRGQWRVELEERLDKLCVSFTDASCLFRFVKLAPRFTVVHRLQGSGDTMHATQFKGLHPSEPGVGLRATIPIKALPAAYLNLLEVDPATQATARLSVQFMDRDGDCGGEGGRRRPRRTTRTSKILRLAPSRLQRTGSRSRLCQRHCAASVASSSYAQSYRKPCS